METLRRAPLLQLFLNGFLLGFLSLAAPFLEVASGKDRDFEPAAPATVGSAIWKIRSDTCAVYLAGSVHLLRTEDYPLPPVYDQAYNDSERLWFEVDLAESLDLSLQQKLIAVGRYANGDTIKDHISAETYALLQGYFKKRGVGGALFESMKPGMLALTIASLEYMRIGAKPDLGVDMVYYLQAKRDGKPVQAFETAEFQLTLFDAMKAKKQERMLMETLRGLEDAEELAFDLVPAWKVGDAEALEKLVNDQAGADQEIAEALIYERNRAWVTKIAETLKGDKNAMIIVGTGHLVGRKSVIDLLEKKGYEAQQLRYTPEPREWEKIQAWRKEKAEANKD